MSSDLQQLPEDDALQPSTVNRIDPDGVPAVPGPERAAAVPRVPDGLSGAQCELGAAGHADAHLVEQEPRVEGRPYRLRAGAARQRDRSHQQGTPELSADGVLGKRLSAGLTCF